MIPLDVMNKLNAYLYSPVEGRIPVGAYRKFFIERINEFFAKQEASPPPSENEQNGP